MDVLSNPGSIVISKPLQFWVGGNVFPGKSSSI